MTDRRLSRRLVRSVALAGITMALAACSLLGGKKIEEPVDLIAVLPIERDPAVDASHVAPGGERVVTAAIYEVLSSSPEWRFVPDLAVSQALSQADLSGDQLLRARWLGKEVKADAVLYGMVSRYSERVGAEYGAKEPAALSITLHLVSVKSGAVLWTGSFEQTQQPLSSNLFNWWQFWRGGPKWFTAAEFTQIAVERMLDDLKARLGY